MSRTDDEADEELPLSQGQIWVIEEGQLLLQTAHTEGQVAGRQDEENNTDEREGEPRIKGTILHQCGGGEV